MDNNARTPPKFRCIKCGTIWKQHADKSWSLFDQYQKPEQCCDNSTDFLSVLEPYDKVSQGLDGFLALEHPLRELSNAITPITEGLYCKVCERDYYVPDDLEDTGICDRCAQTEVTRLETELAAANETLARKCRCLFDSEGKQQIQCEHHQEQQAKLTAAESKLEAARAEQIEHVRILRESIQEYLDLRARMRAMPSIPHTDYWHQSLEEAWDKMKAALAIRAQMDTTLDIPDFLRRGDD